jgi:hypothetical protein
MDDGIARLWRRDEHLVSFCTTCSGMFRVFERMRKAAAATIILVIIRSSPVINSGEIEAPTPPNI